jgi:hypothetical protein
MDLIMHTLTSLAYIIVEPSLLIMLVILSIMFYLKNKKIVAMQRMIIGEGINSPLELTLSQVVFGLLAGIIGSLILSNLGIIFMGNSGIMYLFMISILLMFIKPRFVCFSYSAAILGAVSLAYSYLAPYIGLDVSNFNMDILSLMTFVGVLHVVESLLVIFDGDKGAIPVFSNRNNKIVGGYAFSRYWVIPITVFIAIKLGTADQAITESVATPSWWPILSSEYVLTILGTMALTLTPYFGVVGYSSISFTRSKKKKVISSSIYIFLFGIALILVAQLARFGIVGEVIALIFAPFGHELMLEIQKRIENKRTPIFFSGDEGISVLEVVPYSEIYDLGIRSGDRIISVNGNSVNSEKEVYEAAKSKINNLLIKAIAIDGEIKEVSFKGSNKSGIGILLVPRIVESDRVVPLDENKFSDVLHNISEKINKHDK